MIPFPVCEIEVRLHLFTAATLPFVTAAPAEELARVSLAPDVGIELIPRLPLPTPLALLLHSAMREVSLVVFTVASFILAFPLVLCKVSLEDLRVAAAAHVRRHMRLFHRVPIDGFAA